MLLPFGEARDNGAGAITSVLTFMILTHRGCVRNVTFILFIGPMSTQTRTRWSTRPCVDELAGKRDSSVNEKVDSCRCVYLLRLTYGYRYCNPRQLASIAERTGSTDRVCTFRIANRLENRLRVAEEIAGRMSKEKDLCQHLRRRV